MPPAGTFIARVRDGKVQLPPAIHSYCREAGWSLFAFQIENDHEMTLLPLKQSDAGLDFAASLNPDGTLWIPAGFRHEVSLGEQSVMLRITGDRISLYLRQVFETLGFRPR